MGRFILWNTRLPVPERGNELGLVLAQDHSDAVGDGPLAVPTCSLLQYLSH
jgi:hypothetical protein